MNVPNCPTILKIITKKPTFLLNMPMIKPMIKTPMIIIQGIVPISTYPSPNPARL
jgi:hypothetical protein